MNTDMLPQGFIDQMTSTKYYLVNSNACVEGPFNSQAEADDARQRMTFPKEWVFRRVAKAE